MNNTLRQETPLPTQVLVSKSKRITPKNLTRVSNMKAKATAAGYSRELVLFLELVLSLQVYPGREFPVNLDPAAYPQS